MLLALAPGGEQCEQAAGLFSPTRVGPAAPGAPLQAQKESHVPSTSSRRLLTVAGVGTATLLAAAAPALAAATPTPSPTCKIPSLTVTPAAGPTGTRVTLTGAHFSGCPAKNSTAKPTPVNPVAIGLVFKASPTTAAAKQLGTTSTTPTGSFTITVTIPAGEHTGLAELVAVAQDKATGLGYRAAQPFTITSSAGTTGGTGTSTGTGTGVVRVPTSVPAGSGGMAAASSSSSGEIALLAVAGAAGIGLTAAGSRALRRR